MSAFKRKRGGQNHVDKKAKKGKFVPDNDDTLNGDEQEKTTEVTIPPPVSMVNAVACNHLLTDVFFLLTLI